MSDHDPPVSPTVIALDVGGMSIRSGVVRGQGVTGIDRMAIDHREPADRLVAALAAMIRVHEPSSGQRIAIAVPDPFDHARGVSAMTHKFAALDGVDLRQALVDELAVGPVDIVFVNDAAAAGAGECAGLAGRLLVLTLGTGLGASLFQDERLVVEADGLVIGDLWSEPWPPGDENRTVDERFSATGLAAALGIEPAALPTAIEAPDHRDALRAWAFDLGAFIEQMGRRQSVDAVILGGGVANGFDHFAHWVVERTAVPVRQDRLGASAPLLGAAALAFGS